MYSMIVIKSKDNFDLIYDKKSWAREFKQNHYLKKNPTVIGVWLCI